jgi:hypothetical protein
MKRSVYFWMGGVVTLISSLAVLTGPRLWSATAAAGPRSSAQKLDPVRSQEAFRQVASVLRHPRCMNCHTATEFPRQGNERRRHDMLVLRGADDHGAPAMRCSSCHQNINQSNGVPGAPNWGLAPLAMAWEGLNDHQLAEQLKDPARNGRRSLEQLHEHMTHDELVGWAWQPGGTRDPVPIPRAEFARLVREWIDTGASSPPAR